MPILVALFLWAVFLFGPVWLLGVMLCRWNAWWSEEDKVRKYFEIASPALAKGLIGTYSGYNTHIRTNIPALYNRYRVNRYPSRMSALGAAEYVVAGALTLWYAAGVTAYFFFGWFDNPMIFSGVVLLMLHAVVFFVLYGWNKSRVKWEKYEEISKQEMKARRQKTGR